MDPAPAGGFEEFVAIVARLRAPDGCPWDRAQTHATLRTHMLEEAYEAVAAIDEGDHAHLADELGDVLLQVVLHAQIAADEGAFTIGDVTAGISEKIRRRHPHIFGDAVAATPEEVMHRWDAIKAGERANAAAGEADAPGAPAAEPSALDGVTPTLPALMYAQKISRRAVAVGFEWEDLDGVWTKVHEEIDELKATEPGSPEAAHEVGDLLFTVVNLARKQGLDAETCLREACERFSARFRDMERRAREDGVTLQGMHIEDMEGRWQAAKARVSGAAAAKREGDDRT
ncbi:MAG: nucleoside triphosphate pyrophosphohydrolase [Actinobacteria bacterium]|nr:MAG: nucleoside triphosphate pyrophosphohydrolase [Actinomycetota bacterium]